MKKVTLLVLILALFWGCQKEPQIVINNFNGNVVYSNIDTLDFFPKNLSEKFYPIEIKEFDAFEISERNDLIKLEGSYFSYILHHIFISNQDYFRKNLGEEYIDIDESRYSRNAELYACGKIEVIRGVATFLVLKVSTDEIFKNKSKYLYLLNVENNQLGSIIEISNFYSSIDSGEHLKSYRVNSLFYISDLIFRESPIYQFMPKEMRSMLKIQKGKVKILNYAMFSIDENGRINFKT